MFARDDIFVHMRIWAKSPDIAAAEQLNIEQFNNIP
jgi:hypothetical protein